MFLEEHGNTQSTLNTGVNEALCCPYSYPTVPVGGQCSTQRLVTAVSGLLSDFMANITEPFIRCAHERLA